MSMNVGIVGGIVLAVVIFFVWLIQKMKYKKQIKQQGQAKSSQQSVNIDIIFNVANSCIDSFGMPLTHEGKLELLMFNIWFCMEYCQIKGYHVDYKLFYEQLENFLIKRIQNYNLPLEKKYERVYLFRQDGWENDIIGLSRSDYPRTKQYLPAYLYMCIVKAPLHIYVEERLEKEIDQIDIGHLADFFVAYTKHHDLLLTILHSRYRHL